MKKILIILFMLLVVTGCSNSQDKKVLFVQKDKKYALCVDGELKTKYTYTDYEAVGTEGFLVRNGKKDSYISTSGKDIIAYKEGVSLEVLGNMIIAEDEDKNYTIYDSEGEQLYKSSKKVSIDIYGVPVICQNKKYSVLNDQGEAVIESKDKIYNTSLYNTSFITVSYKKKTVIYDFSSDSKANENGLEVKLAGEYDLIDQDYEKGYLFYDDENKKLAFVDLEGKVQFDVEKDIDSATLNGSTVVAKKDEDVYLLSTDGKVDVQATSYYKNSQNYLVKNSSYIYGPHQFINKGKSKDVNGIQLNPAISKVNGNIFPVYVQSKGYQYYNFSGKAEWKTYYKYAGDFSKNGVAVVSKDGKKYYLIDSSEKKLSDSYVNIEPINQDYYAAYESNTKFVVLDSNGEQVINDYFMGESEIYVFDNQTYGIFNKSGTTHVYNMNEYEEEFTLEGEYKVYNDSYLVSSDYKKYYDMNGEEIYKR